MGNQEPTREALIRELDSLRRRVAELERVQEERRRLLDELQQANERPLAPGEQIPCPGGRLSDRAGVVRTLLAWREYRTARAGRRAAASGRSFEQDRSST